MRDLNLASYEIDWDKVSLLPYDKNNANVIKL